MKFSILIPVYNTEDYLDKCIESVLAQTYEDYEMILVDDGSTDSSSEKCDRYQALYPDHIHVYHSPNRGLISARRIGIARAAGDFCVFVDSDDYVREDLLETLFRHLSEDEDIDLLLYSYSYVLEGKRIKDYPPIAEDGKIWEAEEKRELYEKLIFSNDVTPMWIKACRTSLLRSDSTDYSVYVHKNMAEDLLQSLYLVTYADRIKYIHAPLYCYRYNDESISHNYTLASVKKMNIVHVYHKITEYLPIWGMDNEIYLKKLNARWLNVTVNLFVKSYLHARSCRDRKELLRFDWTSMLPNPDAASYSTYADKNSFRLYTWLSGKCWIKLKIWFMQRQAYESYKRIKKRLRK